MRRSAAPSQFTSKRLKFTPPFASPPPQSNPQASNNNNATEEFCLSLGEFQESKENTPSRSSNEPLNSPGANNHFINLFGNGNKDKADLANEVLKPQAGPANPGKSYYAVVYCKQSTRKHKKWEGDGVMIVSGRTVILQSQEGKEIGRASGYKAKELEDLSDGSNLKIGGKEVEICNVITNEDYSSGKCFQSEAAPVNCGKSGSFKPFVCPSKNPWHKLSQKGNSVVKCRYSTDSPDAVVMPRPSATHQWKFNKKELNIIDVVIDPYIATKLRPHQRDGVVFLYECVMGFRNNHHFGAILADDMGLGKTLQCIAVIWTLLHQGPYGGQPVVKKVLVITPSSLVKNWLQEFKRWLGNERISVYGVDQQNKIQGFITSRLHSVLVISYEMFVKSVQPLEKVNFDLVICDEGHRLKNTTIKTTSTISSIATMKRVVLTGTPIQNDLQEFFSIVEFCNPGILGSSTLFKKVYEVPILKSNEPDASDEQKKLGESRAQELNRIISSFTLRRTSEVINKYLPLKVEMVVMCQPTSLQSELYKRLVRSRLLTNCLRGYKENSASVHLVCIAALKKLCNHPALLYDKSNDVDNDISDLSTETDCIYQDMAASYPADFKATKFQACHSGKMIIVEKILQCLHQNENEKIVLVSSYTQTLDIFENFCQSKNYNFLRLDGSTPSNQRQNLVDSFNKKFSKYTVFLLSSKAGGVGLNLIGASRILLYDIDWNPATDLQAMARVWRDGQKNKVFIYRLLLAGSIEEKIFQRQITKQGISGSIVDMKDSTAQFSLADLKDIFSFQQNCPSSTHDLLECLCDQNGNIENNKCKADEPDDSDRPCQIRPPSALKLSKKISMAELLKWRHYIGPISEGVLEDPHLCAAGEFVTFVFENKS